MSDTTPTTTCKIITLSETTTTSLVPAFSRSLCSDPKVAPTGFIPVEAWKVFSIHCIIHLVSA